MDSRTEVTALLHDWAAGDREALDHVMGLLYDELRRLAKQRLRLERTDHTFGATALVHEAYLRLADIKRAGFEDRAHFLSMASRAMRRVLVDHARRRATKKRGGGVRPVPLDAIGPVAAEDSRRFLELDAALDRLEAQDPRQARIVEQQYFAGLSTDEIADLLGVSRSTVKRDLRAARAWLAAELEAGARE